MVGGFAFYTLQKQISFVKHHTFANRESDSRFAKVW